MTQTLLTPAERNAQAAHGKAIRTAFRSPAELAMRDVLEAWARQRWSDARIVHELVMGRGTVRADMAAIGPEHLVAFEIKGPYDQLDRLVHQVAMYRLAVPELWLVVSADKGRDAELIRYLLPSIGLIAVEGFPARGFHADPPELTVSVIAEAEPFRPDPECLLQLCWVAELFASARRLGFWSGTGSKMPAHARLVEALTSLATPEEQLREVCRALRGREALWRADPPIREPDAAEPGPKRSKKRAGLFSETTQ